MIQRSPKHNLWPPLRTLPWDLTAVRHMSMSTPPQFDWHSILFVFSFSGSTCARLSDSSECDAAAISAEEQQALWQKVPTTLPGGPQMSRQVGQVLLFKGQGLGFITREASQGYNRKHRPLSFLCIYMQCVSVCLSSGIASSIYSVAGTLAQCPCRNVM